MKRTAPYAILFNQATYHLPLIQDGDGCLSESEFVALFEKVRAGYLSENPGLTQVLKKICSPLSIGRTHMGGHGVQDRDAEDRGFGQVIRAYVS